MFRTCLSLLSPFKIIRVTKHHLSQRQSSWHQPVIADLPSLSLRLRADFLLVASTWTTWSFSKVWWQSLSVSVFWLGSTNQWKRIWIWDLVKQHANICKIQASTVDSGCKLANWISYLLSMSWDSVLLTSCQGKQMRPASKGRSSASNMRFLQQNRCWQLHIFGFVNLENLKLLIASANCIQKHHVDSTPSGKRKLNCQLKGIPPCLCTDWNSRTCRFIDFHTEMGDGCI